MLRFVNYPIFQVVFGEYRLRFLRILADWQVELEGTVYSRDDFNRIVGSGDLRATIAEGDRVSTDGLCSFDVSDVCCQVPESELMKEINDLVEELNGRKTSIEACREAYWAYVDAPCEEKLRQLRRSYEATPAHLRFQLLGFEEKDLAIQKLLES